MQSVAASPWTRFCAQTHTYNHVYLSRNKGQIYLLLSKVILILLFIWLVGAPVHMQQIQNCFLWIWLLPIPATTGMHPSTLPLSTDLCTCVAICACIWVGHTQRYNLTDYMCGFLLLWGLPSWRNVTNSENRDGIDQTITDLLRKWSLFIEQSLSLQFCFYPCQKGGKGKVFKLFKKHWSFPSFQLWDHQKRPSVFLIFGKMWLFWYWFCPHIFL